MLATSTTTTIQPSPRSSFSLFNTHIEFRSMFIATLFLFLFLCLGQYSHFAKITLFFFLFRFRLSTPLCPLRLTSPDVMLDLLLYCHSILMSALYVLTHRVHLFLAYLTNPSETSFRSYLTEQSVRHHLSRLDDPADPDHEDSEGSKTNYHRSSSPQSPSSFGSLESGSSAFHFSNRAAIALRTPRHTFHSFGLFTIAAVVPNLKTHLTPRQSSSVVPSARDTTETSDHDFFPFKEVWFVGAFGRWWRGGVVDSAWPPRPSSHSKGDEEGWSSGILNIKSLDQFEDFNGEPNDRIDSIGLFFSLTMVPLFHPSTRFYTQASPSQPLPTTLAHPSDRHPPDYALVIDQRLVVTAALHRPHSQNRPSYLSTHPSTASP